MKCLRISLLLILLTNLILAQQEDPEHRRIVDKLVETALSSRTDYRLLSELCAIGPRLSGYPETQQAIDWAKAELTSIGCDNVWLQPVEVPYWQRGKIELAEIIASEKFNGKSLNIAALGGSIGTSGRPLIAGVIESENFSKLEQLDTLVREKIVFFNEPFDHSLIRTFEAYSKAVRQRSQGPSSAAKLGAVGAIVRSVTSLDDNVPHVGGIHRDSLINPIPAVAIGIQDANFLSMALKQDPELKIQFELSCKDLGTAHSSNVIGEIKGNVYPDEIILIGGHLDAWDKGDGAHDDGAGCVQSMAVLDLFRKLGIKPQRTIRCVLFIDEEQKQTGAKRYAAWSDSLNEKHIAAIESDRGGFTPRGFSVEADSGIIRNMQRFLSSVQTSGIEWIRKGGSGADISKLNNIKAKIGYVPDDQRYFDLHHSANDTFDKVNPRELALGTASIAILTYLISEIGL